jgi:hypothetical protein
MPLERGRRCLLRSGLRRREKNEGQEDDEEQFHSDVRFTVA